MKKFFEKFQPKKKKTPQEKIHERSLNSTYIIEEKINNPNGDIIIQKYEKVRHLGSGGFAKCYEYKSLTTGHSSAVKIISKNKLLKSQVKQSLISEIKIQKSLHHPRIVNFEKYLEDSENVYIFIELCPNQTLKELMKRRGKLTELEVQYYVVQIVEALKYLHSNKIIHRDLKLDNLFLCDGMKIKLGDFGLATIVEFNGEKKRETCGTPNYMAPELLFASNGYSYEIDIWALGIIIYSMVVGRIPFDTNNINETYRRIKELDYSFPDNVYVSESAKDLIRSILVLDPKQRPTLDEILDSYFFKMGKGIPKTLSEETFVEPPSLDFIRQYIPDIDHHGIVSNYIINEKSLYVSTDPNIPPTERIIFSTVPKIRQDSLYLGNVYIKKWIDYSSKYGIGYILSDGNMGVNYNDNSKIIYKPNGSNFIYLKNIIGDEDIPSNHLFTEVYDDDLIKKTELLQKFKLHLFGENKNSLIIRDDNNDINNKYYVYVKKWMKTKHAILFKLNNKVIQVPFFDGTEILINSQANTVIYINKNLQRLSYPLSTAYDSNNQEMTKRLKYIKQILIEMLSSQNEKINY